MSDIPRYEVEGCLKPTNEGCVVMWSDYKKLKAEHERLQRELECAELNWRRQYEDRAEMGKKMQFLSDDRIKIIAKQVALQAENERLKLKKFTSEELLSIKAEVELLQAQFKRDIYNQALAENERLRKAGDAMYDFAVQDSMGIWVMPPFDKWSKEFHSKNNAKGVK